jgi:hypothetical protein
MPRRPLHRALLGGGLFAVLILVLWFVAPKFLLYWWENLKIGWSIGNYLIGFLQLLLGIAVAGVWLLKQRKEEVTWEAKALKILSLLFVATFLGSGIFVAPFVTFIEADTQRTAATGAVADLSQVLLRRQQTEGEARHAEEVRRLKQNERRLEEALAEQDRRLIAVLTTNRPGAAVLGPMAEKPFEMPKIENTRLIDLDAADKIAAAIRQKANADAAKAALATGEAQATFEATSPYVHVLIKDFEDTLRNFAAQNGDTFSSTYTNAADLFAMPYGGHVIMKMEKNSGWHFLVYLRKGNDPIGLSEYNWVMHTPSGAPDFTCTIGATNYKYFANGPGMQTTGSGDIKSRTNNLPQALTEFIGFQKGVHPLTNFLTDVPKK